VASEFAEQSDESGDHSFSHLLVGFRRWYYFKAWEIGRHHAGCSARYLTARTQFSKVTSVLPCSSRSCNGIRITGGPSSRTPNVFGDTLLAHQTLGHRSTLSQRLSRQPRRPLSCQAPRKALL
jgi:hypothetical protein